MTGFGFPYNYGDNLTEEEAVGNFKLFLKNYGPTLCVNGILILLSQAAYAADKPGHVPNSKPGAAGGGEMRPTEPPIFSSIVPPRGFVNSKPWALGGVGAIAWICITAASTGNPALLFACSSVLLYAIGAKP